MATPLSSVNVLSRLGTTRLAPSPEPLDPLFQVQRHGIRLTFKENIASRVAYYANGDIALRLPLTITKIEPPSKLINGRVSHGAMLNPHPDLISLQSSTYGNALQGFDSELYYSGFEMPYVPGLNVAYDVSAAEPLVIDSEASLVCTVSRAAPRLRPGIHTATVFTFVDTLPSEGDFRPPYCTRGSKASSYNESDIDYSVLRAFDRTLTPAGPQNVTQLNRLAGYFERLWLDHVPDFIVRTFHPLVAMPDYGAELTELLGQGQCALNLDFTNAEKRDLAVRLIQIGIDMNGVMQESLKADPYFVQWPTGGGHNSGRLAPQIMAGFLLGDSGLQNARLSYPESNYPEVGQTFIISDNGEGTGNTGDGDPSTTPNAYNQLFGRYDPNATAPPGGGTNFAEWGNQHNRAPYPTTGPAPDPSNSSGRAQDDARIANGSPFPDGTPPIYNLHLKYRTADTANSWWGQAGSLLVMDELNGGAEGVDSIAKFNHAPFFMYLERYDDWVLADQLYGAPGTAAQWSAIKIDQPYQSPNFPNFCRQFWKTHAEGASLA